MKLLKTRLTVLLALILCLTLLLGACGTPAEDVSSQTDSSLSGESNAPSADTPSDSTTTGAEGAGDSTEATGSTATKGQVLKPNDSKTTKKESTGKTTGVAQTVRNDYKIDTPQEKSFQSLKGSTVYIAFEPSALEQGSQDKVLVDYIEKKYSVKVKFIEMGYEETKSKIGQMVAAGNPPDALLMYESNFLQWSYHNILQPIDKYLVNDSTWTGVSRTYYKTNNKTYGITYGNPDSDLFVYMIFYNKTLFEEENAEDPYELYKKGKWTMSKLVEVAKKMTLYREDGKTIKTYGFSTWSPTYFITANGGTGIKETKPGVFKSTLTEAADMSGLNVFYDMVKNNSFGTGIDPYTGFGNRTIAMHLEIPGNAIFQHDYYNTMDDEIGMVPMPVAADGKYYATVMEYGWGVPMNARNPLGGVMFAYEGYQLNNGRLLNNPSAYDLENRRKTLSDEHLAIMLDYYKKATIRTGLMDGLSGWQEGGISKKFWDKILVEKLPPTAAVDAMEGLLKTAIKQTTG